MTWLPTTGQADGIWLLSGSTAAAELAGWPVRFQFELTGGALYTFWVSQDDTGRSNGYLAAGGPGYTGHKDTVGRAACESGL
jgi:hypothetical protein